MNKQKQKKCKFTEEQKREKVAAALLRKKGCEEKALAIVVRKILCSTIREGLLFFLDLTRGFNFRNIVIMLVLSKDWFCIIMAIFKSVPRLTNSKY